MNRKRALGGLIGILCLAVVLLVACPPGTDLEAANENKGKEIVRALYDYKEAHGVFPEQLNELTPDYFSIVPSYRYYTAQGTILADNFYYETNPKLGFRLSYSINTGRGCSYTDQEGRWECHDYVP